MVSNLCNLKNIFKKEISNIFYFQFINLMIKNHNYLITLYI